MLTTVTAAYTHLWQFCSIKKGINLIDIIEGKIQRILGNLNATFQNFKTFDKLWKVHNSISSTFK